MKRRMKRVGVNVLGLAVFTVMVFPVYWMVSTAFKRPFEILSFTPEFIPSPATLANFENAINRPNFWSSVANSLIVVVAVISVVSTIAFLGMPFVLAYTSVVYWVFRGKVKLDSFSY